LPKLGLLAHTTNRAGSPPNKKIKDKHLKLGLMCAPITLGLMGITSRNYQRMWLVAGVITWTVILQGVPLQNLGSAISANCRLWVQITPEQINMAKIWNQLQPIPRWGLKIWWSLVHKQKSY